MIIKKILSTTPQISIVPHIDSIEFGILRTEIGQTCVGISGGRICALWFCDEGEDPLKWLREQFPGAELRQIAGEKISDALSSEHIEILLCGTPFRIRVWQAAAHIPCGEKRTYGELAASIGSPGATRAVGTSLGRNRIALLIPCHRVIPASGGTGKYRWGEERKKALLRLEQFLCYIFRYFGFPR